MKKCGKKILYEQLMKGNTIHWYREPLHIGDELKYDYFRIQIDGEINARWIGYDDVMNAIKLLGIKFNWRDGFIYEHYTCKYDEEHKFID